jgi:dihydrofolate reductase
VHIIITRDKNYTTDFDDCIIVHSLEDALKMVAEDELSFIIGGGEIYKQGKPFSDTIELTRVHARFEDADTFFPEIDSEKWQLVNEEYHDKDQGHSYAFTFLTYERRG